MMSSWLYFFNFYLISFWNRNIFNFTRKYDILNLINILWSIIIFYICFSTRFLNQIISYRIWSIKIVFRFIRCILYILKIRNCKISFNLWFLNFFLFYFNFRLFNLQCCNNTTMWFMYYLIIENSQWSFEKYFVKFISFIVIWINS